MACSAPLLAETLEDETVPEDGPALMLEPDTPPELDGEPEVVLLSWPKVEWVPKIATDPNVTNTRTLTPFKFVI